MFSQDSQFVNFGKPKFWRTNNYEATCRAISVVQNTISIEYTIYTFGAGAAHGYSGTKTFIFVIHPIFYIPQTQAMFSDAEKAFSIIQTEVRRHLLSHGSVSGDEEPIDLDEQWVNDGTADWNAFQAAMFTEEGLQFIFSPYQVAAFAFGDQRVMIKWRTLRPLLNEYLLSALGRESELFDEKSEAEQAAFREKLGIPVGNETQAK